jgi:Tfp pilus assembly protein PilF
VASSAHPRWIALALALLTLGLYARTTAFSFVDYDDDVYVSANPHVARGLSAENLRWAFTSGHAANWHPLTWLSHQLDVELHGLEPGGHHLTNALLHALNAALVFAWLHGLTGARWPCALAAAFFAWHPLRVEAVAWVSERKELLTAALGLASLLAWTGWARTRRPARYAASLGLFALGLLAKPMLVTLPCALLLLDAWPFARLRRGGRARAVLEKLPFFALAGLSSLVTWRVQDAGGALSPTEVLGLEERLANSVRAAGIYLGKTLVPSGLAAFHPHPSLLRPPRPNLAPEVFVALAALLAVSAACLRLRRRAPGLLVGWLWFLGTLVPVIGLVQVGGQGWAERYTYLPSIGLAGSGACGLALLAARRGARAPAVFLSLCALAACGLASARQIETWRDSRTLFTHAVRVDESGVMHANLGRVLENAGARGEAEQHYRRALELTPATGAVRVALARLLRGRGRSEEARAELERAVTEMPDLAAAQADLGWMLTLIGRDAEALPHLRAAVALSPGDASYANVLAWTLATSRTAAAPAEALALAEALCALGEEPDPSHAATRAAALARLGRSAEAARWQTFAIARAPAVQREELTRRLELYRSGQAFLKSP